jgi:hypothetical protein
VQTGDDLPCPVPNKDRERAAIVASGNRRVVAIEPIIAAQRPLAADRLVLATQPKGIATLRTLFDDLIRPRQHRCRDRQTQGLGGLEVDNQVELGRLFDGEVGWLGALQNPIDVDGGPP